MCLRSRVCECMFICVCTHNPLQLLSLLELSTRVSQASLNVYIGHKVWGFAQLCIPALRRCWCRLLCACVCHISIIKSLYRSNSNALHLNNVNYIPPLLYLYICENQHICMIGTWQRTTVWLSAIALIAVMVFSMHLILHVCELTRVRYHLSPSVKQTFGGRHGCYSLILTAWLPGKSTTDVCVCVCAWRMRWMHKVNQFTCASVFLFSSVTLSCVILKADERHSDV